MRQSEIRTDGTEYALKANTKYNNLKVGEKVTVLATGLPRLAWKEWNRGLSEKNDGVLIQYVEGAPRITVRNGTRIDTRNPLPREEWGHGIRSRYPDLPEDQLIVPASMIQGTWEDETKRVYAAQKAKQERIDRRRQAERDRMAKAQEIVEKLGLDRHDVGVYSNGRYQLSERAVDALLERLS